MHGHTCRPRNYSFDRRNRLLSILTIAGISDEVPPEGSIPFTEKKSSKILCFPGVQPNFDNDCGLVLLTCG